MISNSSRGPKNPFNKPLCNFQKTRQQTPIEQRREGEVVEQVSSRQRQKDIQIQVDDIQVHLGQQKSPSEPLEATAFFSPQYSQISERLNFRNDTKELQNSRIQQGQPSQQQLMNLKMQESMQIDSLSPQINANKNISSPQTYSKIGGSQGGQQFTCSNIIDTEYVYPDTISVKAEKSPFSNNSNGGVVNDRQSQFKQYPTADSCILDRSQSYRQSYQQKANNNPSPQFSFFQSKQQQNQNQSNNNSSSASLASDPHQYHHTFGGTAKEESEQKLSVNNNDLINLNDDEDEVVVDEKELQKIQKKEKNKYPNESIFSKNSEYFLEEEHSNPINANRYFEEEEEDEEGLGQEFISKNLDQKVKMIDRRISFASGQYTHSLDNNQQNVLDIYSEGAGENFHNKHFDNVMAIEGVYHQKAHSLNNYNLLGSNNYRNSRSTNTFSPKILQQQLSSQGMLAQNSFGQQVGFDGYNNSFQHGFNSPSLASTQQAQSFYPLTRNHSTNSFKTILKKDKNTFERTDSNRTFVENMNPDLATKKSRNVQFNQYNYVLNYDEDVQEKTDYAYDDQMFFSDDLEEDSQSLPQSIGTGSKKNQQRNPKMTVLEKVSEKDKELKINSSLINSNINIKDSELISSQSSNLIVTKKKYQQIGSASSAINNNNNNSSSAYQDDNNPTNNNKLQDLVQVNQDSILLSQTYIPNNQNGAQTQYTQRDNFQNLFPQSNNLQDIKPSGDGNLMIFNHLGMGGNYTQSSLRSDNNLDNLKSEYNKTIRIQKVVNNKNDSQQHATADNSNLPQANTKLKNIEKSHSKGEKNKSTKSLGEKQIENSKSANHLKHHQLQPHETISPRKQQSSESDLKTNSVQSNLELIMAKISITKSTPQQKQVLRKKKGKTCSSSCNIFQLIWN